MTPTQRATKQSSGPGGSDDRLIRLPVLDATSGVSPAARRPTGIARSKMARRRAVVLITIQVLMIAHVIQWSITGRTSSPIEPSEAMEAVKHGVINAGAIFFALALLSTLVLGRWFCGWGCHLVMLQDGCGWLLRKMKIHPKPFRSRLLIWVPFVLALYMFVWPAVYRWGLAPLSASLHDRFDFVPNLQQPEPWPGFTVEVTTSDFWGTFPGAMIAVPFLLICGFATVYFLGNKGFCTYGCPYGGFFAPLEQYAPGRIRVNDNCEQCGHCTAVCTSNVRVHEEVREYGMVVDPGCMKCMDCVSVCPNDALSFGFGRPAAMKGAAKTAEPRRHYDLSIRQDIAFTIVFAIAFMAFRGEAIRFPLLMTAGTAGVTTWLLWKAWRLLRDASVNLHRYRLKYHGHMRRPGWVFAGVCLIVMLFTMHSGVVNLSLAAADHYDRKVTIPAEVVFSGNPMMMPPEMQEDARRSLAFFRFASRIGDGGIALSSAVQPRIDSRIAWLHASLLEFDRAEKWLQHMRRRDGLTETTAVSLALIRHAANDDRGALAVYREGLLELDDAARLMNQLVLRARDGGYASAAAELLRQRLERFPEDLYTMRVLSLLLVDSGEVEEGVALIRRTIGIDPGSAYSRVHLARALLVQGERQPAVEAMGEALRLAPDDARIHLEAAEFFEALGDTERASHHRLRAGDAAVVPGGHGL